MHNMYAYVWLALALYVCHLWFRDRQNNQRRYRSDSLLFVTHSWWQCRKYNRYIVLFFFVYKLLSFFHLIYFFFFLLLWIKQAGLVNLAHMSYQNRLVNYHKLYCIFYAFCDFIVKEFFFFFSIIWNCQNFICHRLYSVDNINVSVCVSCVFSIYI